MVTSAKYCSAKTVLQLETACPDPKNFDICFLSTSCYLCIMNASSSLPGLKPHRITVEELGMFQQSGAFDRLPRMELLDGILYEMSPQSSAHVRVKNRIMFRLQSCLQALDNGMEAFSEPTIILSDASAPEPDVAICDSPQIEGYFPASSIRLAVEVAVTSLQTDLGYKQSLYAAAAIAEYWVVDIGGRRIYQFWEPSGEGYGQTRIIPFGERIAMITIDKVGVDTTDLV